MSMAPFTTSRVGSITNTRSPVPIVLRVSAMNTTKNCSGVGFSTVLKKHIRVERRNDSTSGTAKAKNKHHIQPTISTSSVVVWKCFCLAADTKMILVWLQYDLLFLILVIILCSDVDKIFLIAARRQLYMKLWRLRSNKETFLHLYSLT